MSKLHLDFAKKVKHDEYYTPTEVIEKELCNYSEQLCGKRVICNCDGKNSNFYKYFKENFFCFRYK